MIKAKEEKSSCELINNTWTSNISDDSVYNHITAYYLHQDQLSWSRIQTIVAIEAALLATSFA